MYSPRALITTKYQPPNQTCSRTLSKISVPKNDLLETLCSCFNAQHFHVIQILCSNQTWKTLREPLHCQFEAYNWCLLILAALHLHKRPTDGSFHRSFSIKQNSIKREVAEFLARPISQPSILQCTSDCLRLLPLDWTFNCLFLSNLTIESN